MNAFDIICIFGSYPNSELRQAMTIWIYLVMICPVLIILLEIEVGEIAYIIRSLCLLKC